MSNDTETLTLTDFLLARIAEDEAAIARLPGTIREPDPDDIPGWLVGHVVMHPDRLRAEIEAKRRIVELHYSETFETKDADGDDRVATWCHECMESDDWPCPTLRILATVYADHPDFRDDWRP